ncbi:sulfate adenylyltransferase subunit 1 [Opitutus terrae]|uniref:sulfate adenylyltransferase n=1 Tax=Opitutus terrae (strain DSM 11246 / JCM 15787 / PB90-1) TaxID=452637 RepID=B1ZSB2_OPITP|nr:GTP-binding protein [Opitutus terrae]ACB75711.1 sulfate adenylyltransferase, large subunit [Opitutus terrae PB90-1]
MSATASPSQDSRFVFPELAPPIPEPRTVTPPVDILRFNTCGSVDDGKSTLIGRLLFDSKSIMEDQLEALERSADITGGGQINLANLTDGLRAEREQGITIDVAYRYFATPRRKFIIADTPGHVQYTRNMVTGASTANLSIILVDARAGVIEQSRRHTAIASLLRIPHLVVAVNKMDLVEWSETRFNEIRAQFEEFLPRLGIKDVKFIPISALNGDNVVTPSTHTPWYDGPTLLGHLETVHIASDWNLSGFRLPVQWVNRPNTPTDPRLHDFRGFSGQIAGGIVRVGQKVLALPAGIVSTVKEIWTYDGTVEEAFCPQSVTLVLADDIDISRGSIITGLEPRIGAATELHAKICWMHPRPLQRGRKYLLKHSTNTVQAVVSEIEHRLDISTLERANGPTELAMNDLGEIRIRTAKPIYYDGYATNRLTGSFILIEPGTHATVGAGMLMPPAELARPETGDYVI